MTSLRMFEERQLLRGFGECLALLGLALAAPGQSAAQAEGNGACSMPPELASVDAVQSAASTISSFEAPGAGTRPGQGTLAVSINSAGAVTGYYLDSSGVYHGFVRAATGTFTSFGAPGAGTHAGQGYHPLRHQLRWGDHRVLLRFVSRHSWLCADRERRHHQL
jgi:hypothetical protein